MEIQKIVIDLLAALFVGAFCYVVPKLKLWLVAKAGAEAANGIILTVEQFVLAADQMFKADDPTGMLRNQYVKEQLTKLGIAITEEINAYIEASVLKLKKEGNK